MKNGRLVDLQGNQYWFLNNELHRVDGPAIITKENKQWFLYGVLYEPTEWLLKLHELGLK